MNTTTQDSKNYTVLAWLLKQDRFSPKQQEWLEHISQQFEILEFQMGDVVTTQWDGFERSPTQTRNISGSFVKGDRDY